MRVLASIDCTSKMTTARRAASSTRIETPFGRAENRLMESCAAAEQHYSPKEIPGLWGVSEATARRIFEDAPGVLKISYPRPLNSHRRHGAEPGRPFATAVRRWTR